MFTNQYADREKKFPLEKQDLAHGRARLFEDVPIRGVIKLLEELDIDEEARNVSPKRYSSFLKEWLDNEMGVFDKPPDVNVAIMKRMMRRKRYLLVSKPTSVTEAKENATGLLEAIIGGQGSGGKYKGDYFLDRPKEWHETVVGTPDQTRRAGDSILIVFYRLDPNYLTRTLYNPDENKFEIQENAVELTEGDLFVDIPDDEEKEKYSALTFAAFTPNNGPMYQIGTNRLVAEAGMVVHDIERDVEDEDDF